MTNEMEGIERLRKQMLEEFGPPEIGLAQGGKVADLTLLGWSDLIAEECLILLEERRAKKEAQARSARGN